MNNLRRNKQRNALGIKLRCGAFIPYGINTNALTTKNMYLIQIPNYPVRGTKENGGAKG